RLAGSARRVQAHRPVFDPGFLQQGYLVNARLQQGAPVLPEPVLRVALAAEGLFRHVAGACRCPVRLLEPPGPHHVRCTSPAEPSRAALPAEQVASPPSAGPPSLLAEPPRHLSLSRPASSLSPPGYTGGIADMTGLSGQQDSGPNASSGVLPPVRFCYR